MYQIKFIMLDLYCFDIGTLQAQECSVNKEGINDY